MAVVATASWCPSIHTDTAPTTPVSRLVLGVVRRQLWEPVEEQVATGDGEDGAGDSVDVSTRRTPSSTPLTLVLAKAWATTVRRMTAVHEAEATAYAKTKATVPIDPR